VIVTTLPRSGVRDVHSTVDGLDDPLHGPESQPATVSQRGDLLVTGQDRALVVRMWRSLDIDRCLGAVVVQVGQRILLLQSLDGTFFDEILWSRRIPLYTLLASCPGLS
jgi:hypothetical protein